MTITWNQARANLQAAQQDLERADAAWAKARAAYRDRQIDTNAYLEASEDYHAAVAAEVAADRIVDNMMMERI